MNRVALAIACLVGCKERGTISLDLALNGPCSATATTVRFQALEDGSCMPCACGACSCDNTNGQKCILPVECGDGCPVGQAHANGINFDPPAAGRYALTYDFLDATGVEVGLICYDINVDADGTTSVTPNWAINRCCP